MIKCYYLIKLNYPIDRLQKIREQKAKQPTITLTVISRLFASADMLLSAP
jgi:hypothetical protein